MSMRFRTVMLLVHDVQATMKFYGSEGLGLPLKHATDRFAELGHNDELTLTLKQVDGYVAWPNEACEILCQSANVSLEPKS